MMLAALTVLTLLPVQEWSSSFQQVLQCGLRRVVPVDHFQVTTLIQLCVLI